MRSELLRWLLAMLVAGAGLAEGQGTAFFYQGQLNAGGSPANGSFDFEFSLYNAATNGALAGGPVTNFGLTVSSGLFQAAIDFGPVFAGTNEWLAIGVRTNGSTNAFSALLPLQPVLPVPYAIFAGTASNLSGTLPASQLSGALASAQLSGTYAGAVTLPNGANAFYGTFNGNGSALTSLNGSQVTSGTVADARLSGNVAFLNGNQTFTGNNVFNGVNTYTNRGNSFIGSFFGNGLVGWITVSGTAAQAMPDAGYLLLSSSPTTVTLPPSSQLLVGDVVRVAGGGTGGWLVAQNSGQTILGNFLVASNNSWLPTSASDSVGWVSLASSSDGTKLVAAAYSSYPNTSSDSGLAWSSSTTSYAVTSVASSASGSILYGAIKANGIAYSTNGGASWNLSGAPWENWQAIATSASGNEVAAVVSGGGIYISSNGGQSWSNGNNAPSSAAWTGIASSADGTKLAAVGNGLNAYTSENSGGSWTQQTSLTSSSWSAIASSADGTKLVAVANPGYVYASTNSGSGWSRSGNAPFLNWTAVACSQDGGRIYAVANPGGVYVSADFGLTWSAEPVPSEDWSSVACSSDGTKAAAAYDFAGSTGAIYYGQAGAQLSSTTSGTSGYISGGQGASVELQYIGNGQFIPLSMTGPIWAN